MLVFLVFFPGVSINEMTSDLEIHEFDLAAAPIQLLFFEESKNRWTENRIIVVYMSN